MSTNDEKRSTSAAQRSSRSVTPAKSRKSSRSETSAVQKGGRSSKVTESDFSPKTRELAIAAKSHVRTCTAIDHPFPPQNKFGRISYAWSVIQETASMSGENQSRFKTAIEKASADINIKKDLMTFVRILFFSSNKMPMNNNTVDYVRKNRPD